MTYYEMIKLNRLSLDKLSSGGFRIDDCKYIELYEEYLRMYRSGDKVTYIVAVLHERYGVCERKIYDIVKRMGRNCTIDAV